MFSGHFYHGILRKSVAVFGTLFNNINIIRQETIVKVPLAYGPKQKFLARLDQAGDYNDARVALKLPRMSFEITSLDYDPATTQNRHNQIRTGAYSTVDSVPYNIGIDLTIMAKNQDEGLQILEQILPTFKPEYTVSVNLAEDVGSVDVPIVLNGVSISDDYEGDFESRRVLTYTLSFTMRTRFFGDTSTRSSIIRSVMVHLNEDANKQFEKIKIELDPFDTEESEEHTVETTYSFIPANEVAVINTTTTEAFTVGEIVISSDTGYGAYVQEVTETSVKLVDIDGYFNIGETITGRNSGHSMVITSYTVE